MKFAYKIAHCLTFGVSMLSALLSSAASLTAQGPTGLPAHLVTVPITEVEEIFGVFDGFTEHGSFKVRYSEDRTNPNQSEFRFWGLALTEPSETEAFLQGRPMRCIVVNPVSEVPSVDCWAGPSKDDGLLKGDADPSWISLFIWLPQIGWAKAECGQHDLLFRTNNGPPGSNYSCKTKDEPFRSSWIRL